MYKVVLENIDCHTLRLTIARKKYNKGDYASLFFFIFICKNIMCKKNNTFMCKGIFFFKNI